MKCLDFFWDNGTFFTDTGVIELEWNTDLEILVWEKSILFLFKIQLLCDFERVGDECGGEEGRVDGIGEQGAGTAKGGVGGRDEHRGEGRDIHEGISETDGGLLFWQLEFWERRPMSKSINTSSLFFFGKDTNIPSGIRLLIFLRPDFLGTVGGKSDRWPSFICNLSRGIDTESEPFLSLQHNNN